MTGYLSAFASVAACIASTGATLDFTRHVERRITPRMRVEFHGPDKNTA